MTAYSEKLKDPRWQKKRLQALELAKWKCEFCEDEKKTLHVHHGAYLKGLEPWGYPLSSLHCLCEDCHGLAEGYKTIINRWLLYAKVEDLETLAEEILPNFDLVTYQYFRNEHTPKAGL